ncbi:MAG TPA: hypothetical protein PLU87_06355 [Sedimentisphaerales bacterium]|nr:hypothetical protein [Sedimentisphaerales bacterium]HRS10473.1 hypothetical protein [Sedimentisphaerales bacterium]HRV47303.1 hypothetical protein [Sedimentisphaerales bacterium]
MKKNLNISMLLCGAAGRAGPERRRHQITQARISSGFEIGQEE